jgi:hypothetical protein
MHSFPRIKTAIPQRRYQYGDYSVTVLGEVESGDGHDYRFVAAFVKEGETLPQLFVVSEKLSSEQSATGGYALRVITKVMDEIMDVNDRWRNLDDYVEQTLRLGAQMLGLEQEIPYQLA